MLSQSVCTRHRVPLGRIKTKDLGCYQGVQFLYLVFKISFKPLTSLNW